MQILKKIEKRIGKLTDDLAHVGTMRPGTLSVQYRKPAEQKHPFRQISYTHKGKSHSEYVRPENVETIQKEIAAYKRFKDIHEQLIELSIQASRIRCSLHKTSQKASSQTPQRKKCT